MKSVLVKQEHQATHQVAFHIKDAKGRWMGCKVFTGTLETAAAPEKMGAYYLLEPGFYFTAYVQATRDGKLYGASQPSHQFKTVEERADWIAKRVESGRKAAEKKAA
jgi:hypothetical protein